MKSVYQKNDYENICCDMGYVAFAHMFIHYLYEFCVHC